MTQARPTDLPDFPDELLAITHRFLVARLPDADQLQTYEVQIRERLQDNPLWPQPQIDECVKKMRIMAEETKMNATLASANTALKSAMTLAVGGRLNIMEMHETGPQKLKIATPTAMEPEFMRLFINRAQLPENSIPDLSLPLHKFFYSLAGKTLPYAARGQFAIEETSGDLYLEKLVQPKTATRPRPPEVRAKIFKFDD